MNQPYKNAIEVQDACNMVAVANQFARDLSKLRKEENLDSAGVNKHPVVVMYIDKLADLAGRPDFTKFSEAYDKCIEKGKHDSP